MPAQRSGSPPPRQQHHTVSKRTYQACIPCRTSKLRCDLGNPDEPHDPPCRRCLRTGRDCVFGSIYGRKESELSSRRSASVAVRDGIMRSSLVSPSRPENDQFNIFPTTESEPGPSSVSVPAAPYPSHKTNALSKSPVTPISIDASGEFRFARGEALENPADALRILRAAADADDSGSQTKFTASRESPAEKAHWNGWFPVRDGLLTADEARSLLACFKNQLNICHPIVPAELLDPVNFHTLIAEPILLAAMVATAARYHDLGQSFDRTEPSRSKIVQTRIMAWLLQRISYIAMGQGSSIGTVEALLVLSEWPPEPSLLSDTILAHNDRLAQTPISPCRVYDDVSWSLTGMAVRMAQELDLQDESTYFSDSQAEWVVTRRYRAWTMPQCGWVEPHGCKVLQWVEIPRFEADSTQLLPEMSTNWYGTMSRIGYMTGDTTFPLPRVQMKHREILGVTELTHIISLLQELLYATPDATAELIRTMRFESTLRRLKPELDSLWQRQAGDLPSYDIFHTDHELFSVDELREIRWRMDYDYVKLYANAIAMRAAQHRLLQRHKHKSDQDRVFQANVIQSSEGSFIIEAVDAATSLVRCGVAMQAKHVLRYCPCRIFLRLMFASVFLMKAMSFGAVAPPEQDVVDLQYALITSLKMASVDDQHVASYIASLLDRVFPSIPTEPIRPAVSSEQLPHGTALNEEATLALLGFGADMMTDLSSSGPFGDLTGFGYDPSSIISDIEEMLAVTGSG